MSKRLGPGPGFRAGHLLLASAAAAGACGVLSQDSAEWVHWLTAGGQETSSRRERVSVARGLIAGAAWTVAAVGLAGVLVPGAVASGYSRLARALREAVAGRKRYSRSGGSGGVIFAAFVATCAMFAVAYAIHRSTGTPMADLTRDPNSVMGAPPWVGLLSNVGVLLWTGAATACLLGGLLLWDRAAPRRRIEFFWVTGGLTSLMVLDDLFQLHEGLLPRLTGLPEMVFVCAYPMLILAYFAREGAQILASDWPLLLVAVVLLGASMSLDTILASSRHVVLEDAGKLAGILLWTGFCVRAVREALAPRSGTADAGHPAPWAASSTTLGAGSAELASRGREGRR